MLGIAELYIVLTILQPVVGLLLFPLSWISRKWVRIIPIFSLAMLAYPLTVISLSDWSGDLQVSLYGFTFLLDPLAKTFSIIVLLIGILCILYSYEYMEEDSSTARYYFWMLTFVASMLILISADSLILFIAAWEMTGLCSFSLIAHRNHMRESLRGAYKALAITEVGSSMLIAGLLILEKTYNVTSIKGLANIGKPEMPLAVSLLLITIAVVSKSVQYPLHIWLPDAMYAPTPVSALLHAATMVKAGVYLLARLWNLYLLVPGFFYEAFLMLGSATMIIGGAFMLRENDLKRMLAYSTISQIGYMVSSIGLGTVSGFFAGVYHLVNHAISKGLLFLSAGAIEHETGTRNLDRLGGLMRTMPITSLAFIVGALSISGVPPLNCFVSKWIIYEAGLLSTGETAYLSLVMVVAAFLSSAFSLAALLKAASSALFGDITGTVKGSHDPGLTMSIPLVALTILAVALGVYPYPLIDTIVNVAKFNPLSGTTLLFAGSFNSIAATTLILLGVMTGVVLYRLSARKIAYTEVFLCGEEVESGKAPSWMSGTDFYSDIVEGLKSFYNHVEPEKWPFDWVRRLSLLIESFSSKDLSYEILCVISILVCVLILILG